MNNFLKNLKSNFHDFIEYVKLNKKTLRRLTLALVALIVIFIIALKKEPVPEPPPEDYTPHTEEYIVQNIKIEDFEPLEVGVLHNKKYYRINYGVYIEDESYVGNFLGTSTGSTFTPLNGTNDVYEFVELRNNLYGDTEVYEVNTDDEYIKDNVLLLKDMYNEGFNGYWVMSTEPLEKTYVPKLLESKITKCIVLPDDTDDSSQVDIDVNGKDFQEYLKSLKRIKSSLAYYTSTDAVGCYILLGAGDGFLYGNLYYYNYVQGESYLVSMQYPEKIVYSGNDVLFPYLYFGDEAATFTDSETTTTTQLEGITENSAIPESMDTTVTGSID